MNKLVTRVTERGQASIPAFIRNTLGLEVGSVLSWSITDGGHSILVVPVDIHAPRAKSAHDMIGWGRRFHAPRRTADWMRELREGEVDI